MNTKPDPELIDDENPEWTDEVFAKAKPASEVVPEIVEAYKRSRGRPKAERTKTSVSIRLDTDVLEKYKSSGTGWQTRINDLLREHAPK